MTAGRSLAAVWVLLVATAAIGHVADAPLAIVGAWFGALLVLAGSGSTVKAQHDERLERPRVSDRRGHRVRGPARSGAADVGAAPRSLEHRALTVSLLAWLPFTVLGMGCKCGHYVEPPIHWTETVSWLALLATQLMNGLTVATSLVAFARRTDEVPEARIQGPWRITPSSPAM